MKTTRRRLLSLIGLGAAAAALAPSVGQAAAVCEGCEWLRGSPVVLPDGFRDQVTPELTDMVIRAAHDAAGSPSIVSHQNAAALIYAKAFSLMGTTFTSGATTTETLTVSGNTTFGTIRMSNSAPLSAIREASRRELGLPLNRPSTDAEIARAARLERQAEFDGAFTDSGANTRRMLGMRRRLMREEG